MKDLKKRKIKNKKSWKRTRQLDKKKKKEDVKVNNKDKDQDGGNGGSRVATLAAKGIPSNKNGRIELSPMLYYAYIVSL